MSRPLIGNRNSWANFEKCALEVFILALVMLRDKEFLPRDEDSVKQKDSLNRRLHICLLDAIKEWERINDADIVVVPEPNLGKQPDLENEEEVNEYERKKPDFQWKFRDRLAGEGNRFSSNKEFLSYDIECKRLGENLCRRDLSKEYVNNGIRRFIMNTHCYGQFASSGLMIGYIQDVEPHTALNQVNSNNHTALLPEILLSSEGWKIDVSRLDHKLDRLVQPTQFDLRHLWVDLRHHYKQNTSASKKQVSTRNKRVGKKAKSSKTQSKEDTV